MHWSLGDRSRFGVDPSAGTSPALLRRNKEAPLRSTLTPRLYSGPWFVKAKPGPSGRGEGLISKGRAKCATWIKDRP